MKNVFKRFVTAALILAGLAGCSHLTHPKIKRPTPPDLLEVEVRDCQKIKGDEWCLFEPEVLLTNDENLKNYIEELLTAPCWAE